MGFLGDLFNKATDEIVKKQGFEDGAEGRAPRMFLSDGEHKKAYTEAHEKGQKSSIARAIKESSR